MAPILVLAASLALAADGKQPITHEALWLMKRVGAPVVSPDGRWVVAPVTEPAYDDKDQMSDLWIVPADGSAPPRRLTFTRSGESGVAWSPDSRRIAFSARREGDEAAQIYVLDIASGGEAVRATTVSTGAGSPKWRPDGRAILFESSVYPGALDDEANKKIAAERKARKYTARVYTGFPIRHWDHWLDDTQAHVLVQSLDPGSRPKDLLAGSSLVSGAGFGGSPTLSGEELSATWTPDGNAIVFAATTQRNAAAYANVPVHLWQVGVTGGEPLALTTGEDSSYARPTFSPDGKWLYALVEAQDPKVSYHLNRVARFAWPGAKERSVVTATWDRSAGAFALTPDSRTLYVLAEDAGLEKLYVVPAEGGEVRQAKEMSSGAFTSLTIPPRAAQPILIANWESASNPPEVVRIDLTAGRPHKLLTQFNAAAAEKLDLPALRHFFFTSKRGQRIHNLVALPPAFDPGKKYPLVTLIHGGANSMWRDQFVIRWNYHLLAAPGYVVLLTNYSGSTGFGEKFAQDIEGDVLRGPGEELNEAVDEAIKRFPFIDAGRLAAGGASYGGHLANWLQATTTRFRCLFSHAGLINLESQWGTSDTIFHREINNGGPIWEQSKTWREQNPIRHAAKFKTPMLLTIGERDFRVPLNQTLENWSYLQRLRIPSRLVVFPDENHWILKGENHRFFFQELHGWLGRWLK